MSASKKRIAIFFLMLLIGAAVTGAFSTQESYANDRSFSSPMKGSPSTRNLYHSSVYNGYTIRYGIDVSSYQGTINWQSVAASGIEFAFIRVGVRGWNNGLTEDYMAVTNILGALNAGLKIGVYVYSQAINTAEAVEEADLALRVLAKCGVGPGRLALPITIDVEYGDGYVGRLYNAHLNKAQRTEVTLAFLNRVAAAGYQGCVYSGKYLFAEHDMSQIASRYHVWIAYWAQTCGYYGYYTFWQYGLGNVPGINGGVDVDVWYDYTKPAQTTPSQPAEEKPPEETPETPPEDPPAEPAEETPAGPAEDPSDTDKTTETASADVTKPDDKTPSADDEPLDQSSKYAVTGDKDSETQPKTTAQVAVPQPPKRQGWQRDARGNVYYADPSTGKNLTGFNKVEGHWYFFDLNGVMATGWLELNGKKFCFNDLGHMLFGWQQVDGEWYQFDIYTGAMVKDTWIDGYNMSSSYTRGSYYKDIRITLRDIGEIEISPASIIRNIIILENGMKINLHKDLVMR